MKISWTLTLGSASLVAVVACVGARAIVPLELKSETTVVAVSVEKKPIESKKEASVEEPNPVAEQPKAAETAPAPTKNNPTSQTKNSTSNTPSTAPPAAISSISVGTITSTYTYCQGSTLGYVVYPPQIHVVRSSTPTTFSWRLEASDGEVLTSGSETVPANTNFYTFQPYGNPAPLASILGVSDGDSFRVVVTSPSYSAGGWSTPVPLGSESGCAGM